MTPEVRMRVVSPSEVRRRLGCLAEQVWIEL